VIEELQEMERSFLTC